MGEVKFQGFSRNKVNFQEISRSEVKFQVFQDSLNSRRLSFHDSRSVNRIILTLLAAGIGLDRMYSVACSTLVVLFSATVACSRVKPMSISCGNNQNKSSIPLLCFQW